MDQKEKIISNARLMFMRYGIRSVTMDDLARHLGISKKTLYLHVENKADLIRQIFEYDSEMEKAAIRAVTENADNAIEEIFGIAQFVISQLRELTSTVIYDLQKYYAESWTKMEAIHIDFTTEVIKKNLERGIEEGLYRKEVNIDIISKLYAGKTSLIVDEAVFPLKKYDKQNLFKVYINYHLHGIVSEKGLKYIKGKELGESS